MEDENTYEETENSIIRHGRNLEIEIGTINGLPLWMQPISIKRNNVLQDGIAEVEVIEHRQRRQPVIEPPAEKDLTPGEKVLGYTVDRAIEIWKTRGSPEIRLSSYEVCTDLSRFLSPGRTHPRRQVEAIRNWLESK
jgi:hypothetical protein